MVDRIALAGLIVGMVALWVWNWSLMRMVERNDRLVKRLVAAMKLHGAIEGRCGICKERDTCEAFETGGSYPCGYFEEEGKHGEERL